MSQASIKDVAKLAGVSIATVSRCVNNPEVVRADTLRRVQSAIDSVNYSPNTLARDFRSGKTRTILVVMPSVGDPFFADIMQGIREIASQSNYNILIREHTGNQLEQSEFSTLLQSTHTDGVILLASLSPVASEYIHSKQRRIPIVIGCEVVSADLTGLPCVHLDNVKAAKQATQHLISLGHERIAFISGHENSLLTADRQQGFIDAMTEAGLEVSQDCLRFGNMTIEGAAQATQALMALAAAPTAIFCANDEMALGCLHQLSKLGVAVPQQVSVMGFDNIRYSAISQPPLTTIEQPAKTIGQRTATRLLAEINGESPTNQESIELVEHQLIVRSSTAKP